MLLVHRSHGALTVVSRLARDRVLAVVAGVLALLAAASARAVPRLAAALLAAAVLVVLLGARTLRARFERGQVTVRSPVPLRRAERRSLAAFGAVCVETFAEARRRRADRLARGWAERSGTPMPAWLRPPDAPGANDALRRLVLVARDGDPLPITVWLPERDDLEPALLAVEAVLR
jgi:lysylphosphatidylglycerol synthetase-like protein (DUF2156 family)